MSARSDTTLKSKSDSSSEEIKEAPTKNHKLSYFYALIAAILYGTANVGQAEVSKLGIVSVWAMWLGPLIVVMTYHTYNFIMAKLNNETYFVWEKSNYV